MRKKLLLLQALIVCLMCLGCGGTKKMNDEEFLKMYSNTYFLLINLESNVYSGSDILASKWENLSEYDSAVLALPEELEQNENLVYVTKQAQCSKKYLLENLQAMSEHDKKYDDLYNELNGAYKKYLELYTLYQSPCDDADATVYREDIDRIDGEIWKDLGVIEGLYPGELRASGNKFEDELTEKQKKDYASSTEQE